MNIVSLVGRICKEVSLTQAGETQVAKFTVAVDRKFKRENDQNADFISCVAFGKTAEFINKYFAKGQRIGLTGRIQTGSYTNKDGQKVYTTDVVVENCEFVESKASQQTAAPAPAPAPVPQYNAPQPQYQQAPQQAPAQPQYAPQQAPAQPVYQQPYQQNTANQPWMQIPPGSGDDIPFT